jgi:hypothetical protein
VTTIKRIQLRLKKLQARTGTMVTEHTQSVVDEIHALMERHGLTVADIEGGGKKIRRIPKPNVARPAPDNRRENMKQLAKKGKLPAKYRNPQTGETWSGWARPPAWIAHENDRTRFLIDAEGNESVAVKRKRASKAE